MDEKLKYITPEFIHEFGSLDFLANQIVEGFMSGKHKSPYQGFSVEFAEHRLYNPGDSLKHIDWKRYAKTDKLFIKKYEAETNLRCQFILDASSSMFFPVQKQWTYQEPNKYLFSTYAIASLMQLFRKQRDAIGLSIIGESLLEHTEIKNLESHQYELFKKLEQQLVHFNTNSPKTTSFSEHLKTLVLPIKKRSVFMLFSDLLFDTDEAFKAFISSLEYLRHNGHEVIVFHCLDYDKEVDLNFSANHLEFIGLENEGKLKGDVSNLKKAYQEKMTDLLKDIKSSIIETNNTYVPVNINEDISHVLMAYMSMRSSL
ncbi:MAG: DUF58 domain-containing protein [Flavobacteriales bacterium]